MSREPQASVVIPALNAARFIARALDSVAAQGVDGVEALVVDNGSTDATPDIAAGYPFVRLLRSERGTAVARNHGIAAARGGIIALLDADDAWRPGKLAGDIEFLSRHPEFDGVFTWMETRLEAGAGRPAWLKPELLERPHLLYIPSAFTMRASMVKKAGGFDETFAQSEDMEFFLRARDRGCKFGEIKKPLVERWVHGGNASTNVERSNRELLLAVRRSLAFRRARPGTETDAP
jgi:glycosyltransferase involved in cell wall biosynthesis